MTGISGGNNEYNFDLSKKFALNADIESDLNLSKIFNIFDTDGNGVIENSELSSLFNTVRFKADGDNNSIFSVQEGNEYIAEQKNKDGVSLKDLGIKVSDLFKFLGKIFTPQEVETDQIEYVEEEHEYLITTKNADGTIVQDKIAEDDYERNGYDINNIKERVIQYNDGTEDVITCSRYSNQIQVIHRNQAPEDAGEDYEHELLSYTVYNGSDFNAYLNGNLKKLQADDGLTRVEYDGNGNTKGVIVQESETIAEIARKFGCDKNQLIELNRDIVKGRRNKEYFEKGAEILIPGELSPEDFARLTADRLTPRQMRAYKEYAENLQRQQVGGRVTDHIHSPIYFRDAIEQIRACESVDDIARLILHWRGIDNPTEAQIDSAGNKFVNRNMYNNIDPEVYMQFQNEQQFLDYLKAHIYEFEDLAITLDDKDQLPGMYRYDVFDCYRDRYRDNRTYLNRIYNSEGGFSRFINWVREYWGYEATRENIDPKMDRLRLQCERFDLAMRGEYRDANGNILSFEDAFYDIFGTQYSEEKAQALEETRSEYERYNNIDNMVDSYIKRLSPYTIQTVHQGSDIQNFNRILSELLFDTLQLNEQQVRDLLNTIDAPSGKVSLYGRTFSVSGGLRPYDIQAILNGVEKYLRTWQNRCYGLDDNADADARQSFLNEKHAAYYESMKALYGEEDAKCMDEINTLIDNYVKYQGEWKAGIKIGTTLIAMAATIACPASAPILSTCLSIGAAAYMITDPLELWEKATDGDGMTDEDWIEYAESLGLNIAIMGAGAAIGKISECTKELICLKGAEKLTGTTGKEAVKIMDQMCKEGRLAGKQLQAYKNLYRLSNVGLFSVDFALNTGLTYAISGGEADLFSLDTLMNLLGSVQGTVMSHKQAIMKNLRRDKVTLEMAKDNFRAADIAETKAKFKDAGVPEGLIETLIDHAYEEFFKSPEFRAAEADFNRRARTRRGADNDVRTGDAEGTGLRPDDAGLRTSGEAELTFKSIKNKLGEIDGQSFEAEDIPSLRVFIENCDNPYELNELYSMFSRIIREEPNNTEFVEIANFLHNKLENQYIAPITEMATSIREYVDPMRKPADAFIEGVAQDAGVGFQHRVKGDNGHLSSLVNKIVKQWSRQEPLARAVRNNDVSTATSQIFDLYGGRLIADDMEGIQNIYEALYRRIESGEYIPEKIFNYAGNGTEPYFTVEQMRNLDALCKRMGYDDVVQGLDKGGVILYDDGYTSTHVNGRIRIENADGTTSYMPTEIQIRTSNIQDVCDAIHLPYDIFVNPLKDILGDMPEAKREVARNAVEVFRSMNTDQQKLYYEYQTNYIKAKKENSSDLPRPSGYSINGYTLPDVISLENLIIIENTK